MHIGIHARVPGEPQKLLNRTVWIGSDGIIQPDATYDKLHLFDYGNLKESSSVQGGDKLTDPFQTSVGRVGSLICFDLRFPEASIKLTQPRGVQGGEDVYSAQILTYPSAFTVRTGEAHWEVLLRARAIETQSWVVAAAQCGMHNEKRISYGHSMVVDPWGRIALDMGGYDGSPDDVENVVGFVDLDMRVLEQVRREMPLARRKCATSPPCRDSRSPMGVLLTINHLRDVYSLI